MIFKQIQQVLDGTKTQTRRVVKEGEKCWDDGITVARQWIPEVVGHDAWTRVWTPHEIKWQVGRTYAVQPGRGKKAVGRIRITKIRRERLQGIMPLDIGAEGIEPIAITPNRFMAEYRLEDFAELWDGIYSKPYRWEDNPECWVLDFERSEG